MTEAGFLVLGIAAGILSGLFGIGGGIVMVPSLIMFFGMGLLDANATSLAAMLLPVGALGVWSYYKAGLVNIRESLWIAGGLLAGSFAGGELAVNINEEILSKIYAAVLLYVAVSYLDIPSLFKKKHATKKVVESNPLRPVWAFLLVGLGAGIFAGLFGKGGGLIIVPALIGFFKYDPRAAAATSLAALQLPVGLPSVIIYAQEGYLNISAASLIATGIVLGVLAGSKINAKLSSSFFRKLYAFFLLAVSFYMIYKYI
jgi:uncharacterized membrane protein YfcA